MLPKTHQDDWEELAACDPMWAILTHKAKQGNKWETQAFFDTGRAEIDRLWQEIGPLSIGRNRALDFGCGLGRLTRALLQHYREAYGVDVSTNMVQQARTLTPECIFHCNQTDDLSLFPDEMFDLVYSNIVLQHLPSREIIARYIAEFFRVTTPGGLVVFQVPCCKSWRNRLNLKRSVYHLLRSIGVRSEIIFRKPLFKTLSLHPMRMTAVPRNHVRQIVKQSCGELIRTRRDASAHFAMFYFCRRLPGQAGLSSPAR